MENQQPTHNVMLKNFRKLAGQSNVAGFQWPDEEMSITSLCTHQLCNTYIITSPEGAVCTIKTHNESQFPDIVGGYLLRESVATNILNDVTEGVCPRSYGYDGSSRMVIQEGLTGFEVLQHRILDQSKVDHGVTCGVARCLARLHKSTHILSNAESKFTELTSIFGPSTASRCPNSQAYLRLFDVDNQSPGLGQETRKAVDVLLRHQTFMSSVDAVRQMFNDNMECVIHGQMDMSNVLVNSDQDVKLVNWGFSQMGPGVYDLGCLVAHYITAHYIHMLTEENNSSHRQVAYAMQDAITKTVDAYLEDQSAYTGNEEQHQINLVSALAAFTGLDLVRKALDGSSQLSDNLSVSVLMSGQRLLSRYQTIDNMGRFLMIALQLC